MDDLRAEVAGSGEQRPPGRAGSRSIISEYLAMWASRSHLHRAVLRTGSTHARELLAALVTRHDRDWPTLRAEVLAANDATAPAAVSALLSGPNAAHVLTLARVVALQNRLEGDREFGHALYRLFAARKGLEALKDRHAKLAADLAVRLGDHEFARRIVDRGLLSGLDRAAIRADIEHPALRGGQASADWLEALNYQFVADGVAPIELLPEEGERSLFDRLAAAPRPQVPDGPLVSVVVTTWCPGPEFISAFRSVTAQTWRNLEILVIDDCSPDEYQEFIQSVVSEDSRARLIRMPRNGGTYVARNRGLREAKGDLFTVHDSDDWAHPERIQRQVDRMQANPHLISSSSRALRLDDDLVFSLPGVSASRENASSLTFWRERAIEAIGFYDASRKGADTEYAVRLTRHFGERRHALLKEHLACIRLRVGSLSREEFKPGWRHPARAAYRRGYLWWHDAASWRSGVLRNNGSVRARCFPEPIGFMPERESERAQARRQWDVVYLMDARADAPLPEGAVEEMLELADAGAKVALMHIESLLYPFVKEFEGFSDEVQGLIARGRLGEVLPTDAVRIATLVVRDPSCLQFTDDEPSAFTAERVLLVPDRMPRGLPRPFDCADVEANIARKLGVSTSWLLPPGENSADWPGIAAEPRRWGAKVFGRSRYAAPRPRAVKFGRGLTVACLADGTTPDQRDTWAELAGAVRTRVWLAAEPDDGPASGNLDRVLRARDVDSVELALTDVVLLQCSPQLPGARQIAQAAIASGCIVLGAESLWGEEFAHSGLLAPVAGFGTWLSAFLANPPALADHRRFARKWLHATGGRRALIEQLTGKHLDE
ncbi:glycosyltransferase family 2 protein [Luteimonas kalidii]|uniref:Glycosyltransferase family 2 protein n=1 Tax=Luteimonas kalidii TaxID=3042025 RepID=A0ABT6JY94_9GAMM|nr:glycosyltransferase family 2 protein [Luteimonas kalidii]MDH5835437.1 glycosyltransferase family 2 protein [Luteimonas kalidii]